MSQTLRVQANRDCDSIKLVEDRSDVKVIGGLGT